MADLTYSIIIPHKNSLDTLPRLINSIPDRNDLEILIVDNSFEGISYRDVKVDRKFKILSSDPNKFAGGARNCGMDEAKGEWFVFADADDYFSENAFDVFDKYISKEVDIVYFKSDSVYDDTLEQCDRHIPFVRSVDNYINKSITELEFKFSFVVPWAKLVRKSFVNRFNFRYDEVIAANDVMFSVKTGYYAKNFFVSPEVVYVVTMRRGSLSQRWDYPVIKSRYMVALRKNKFLKEHDLSKYQTSVMLYLVKSLSYGIGVFFEFLGRAIYYKQNLFVGCGNWVGSFWGIRKNFKKNRQYIVK